MQDRPIINVYYDSVNNKIVWGYGNMSIQTNTHLIDNINWASIFNTESSLENFYSLSPFQTGSYSVPNILVNKENNTATYMYDIYSDMYNKVIASPTAGMFYLGNMNTELEENSCFNQSINLQNFFNNTSFAFCENAANLFSKGENIEGHIIDVPNATDISYMYNGCTKLTGQPSCGTLVENMVGAYQNCLNLSGGFAIGPQVIDMSDAYRYCSKLYNDIIIPSGVKNITNAFQGCYNSDNNFTIKNVFIPESVEEASNCFKGCHFSGGAYFANYRNNYVNTNLKFEIGPNLNLINGHFGITFFGTEAIGASSSFVKADYSRGYPTSFYINSFYQNLNLYNCFTGCITGWDGLMGYTGGSYEVHINGKINNLDYAFSSPTNGCCNIFINNVKNLTSLNNTFRSAGRCASFGVNIEFNNFDNSSILYLIDTFNQAYQRSAWNFNTKVVQGDNTINITGFMHAATSFCGYPYCGLNVIDMTSAYSETSINTATCGPNVINMDSAYSYCQSLRALNLNLLNINNVKNMRSTFHSCYYLTGPIICGPNVIDMSQIYSECNRLEGSPICGENVITMAYAYNNCQNIIGEPVIGNNVTNAVAAYNNCKNLFGTPSFGNHEGILSKSFNFAYMYYQCPNLFGNVYLNYTGSSINFYRCFNGRDNSRRLDMFIKYDNMNTWFSSAFGTSLTWIPMEDGVYNEQYNVYIHRNKFNYLNSAYDVNYPSSYFNKQCNNLIITTQSTNVYTNKRPSEGQPIYIKEEGNTLYIDTPAEHLFFNENFSLKINYQDRNLQELFPNEEELFSKVISMNNAFNGWNGYGCDFLGNPICGINTLYLYETYGYQDYITEAICKNNVINMVNCYAYCPNLINAVCGENVVNMYSAYCGCNNLIIPTCGNNVIDLGYAYMSCNNLTSAVCGNNVLYLGFAYKYCPNLTIGVSGPNVIRMTETYNNCTNLVTATCGDNVIYMNGTFNNCRNLVNVKMSNSAMYLVSTFENCTNLTGDLNFYNNNLKITQINMNKFLARHSSVFGSLPRLNIRVKYNSAFNDYFYNHGGDIFWDFMINPSWSVMTNGYYNERINVYVYYNLTD